MNKIVYRKGDLFKFGLGAHTRDNVIIPHVVNIHNRWGSGFVVPLGKYFPYSKSQYQSLCQMKDNKQDLFGLTQFVVVNKSNPMIVVANMFAQTLGGDRPLFYNHLATCMDNVANTIKKNEIIVAPKFGAGLAGGNWSFIEELIEDCWLKRGIEVYVYEL